jgi:hypothetical protein
MVALFGGDDKPYREAAIFLAFEDAILATRNGTQKNQDKRVNPEPLLFVILQTR